jgi:uncharacterized protein YbjT (DUF2867 family)
VVAQLVAEGHTVRVMSRRPGALPGVELVAADLLSGYGLESALDGVETVIHAASQPARETERVDVRGTQLLLDCAQEARVGHVIYISIVGIDRIPYAYYRHKLAAEALVARGEVPWSIVRATQFYDLVDGLIAQAARLPLPILPLPTDLRLQPVDVGDVAGRLCAIAAGGPAGRLPDMGGPEVLTLGELTAAWRAARGVRKRVVHLPLPGALARAFRMGAATCPDARSAGATWGEWLSQRAALVH